MLLVTFIVGLVLCVAGAYSLHLYDLYGVYRWQHTMGCDLLGVGVGMLFAVAIVYCL